jgi:hypothetical protein
MRLRRLALVYCAAALLRADFDPKRWERRQPLPAAAPATRVKLNAAVYAGARESLADLRIVRDSATEVPYLLSIAQARLETASVPVRLVNRESRQGALMVTLEFDGKSLHNHLTLDVTRDNFRTKLKLEASDNGQAWATVRTAAYVFRYQTDDGRVAEHLTVQYPDSRRRLVRLTLEDWPHPAQFTGASVTRSTANQARRSTLWQGLPATTPTNQRKTTCYLLDTGTNAPRDRLVLQPAATPAVFHRSVTVEESRDGQHWSWLAASALYRTADDESRTVEFNETRARWQRLCIFQGDDQPLKLEGARAEGIDREVAFRVETPGTYWLYYGNRAAIAPVYDLAQSAGSQWVDAAHPASLAASEANPQYTEPPPPTLPWTDRYPAVLYGALGASVLGLGWMALRLLRSAV